MGRGWVAPGYKYLGPGNDLNRGEPTNYNDSVAQKHDIAYNDFINANGDPYWNWNEADQKFLQDLHPDDIPTYIAKGVFSLKKGAASVGLLGTLEKKQKMGKKPGQLRREADEKSSWYSHKAEESTRNIFYNADGGQKREAPNIDPVSSENKKLRGAQATPVPMSAEGDVDMGETSEMRAAGKGGGDAIGTHETPVIWHPPRKILFTETHTQLCKTRFAFSVNNLQHASTIYNSMFIRMNSWFGMFDGQANPNGVTQTAGIGNVSGIGVYFGNNGAVNTGTLIDLPNKLAVTGGSSPNFVFGAPVPWYTKLYDKVYDNYVVLETRWKITIDNPNSNVNANAMVLWDYDTYGASSTGNIMPQAGLKDMLEWPHINIQRLPGKSINSNGITVISGVWKPNTKSRNVTNDADIKTWAVTGAAPNPVYFENLQLRFFKDFIAGGEDNVIGPDVVCFMELDYVVQYKDLKVQMRYPLSGQSTISLVYPTDILQSGTE